ncbi:Gfo/Idh/MocA family oxidoreductase [Paenibacillus sp. LHD-117]|uniref:Gfo/Idh/MocA family protein n=1 Tax=Paenibacillus sp. LHD-117 TaxID=3071412 RepID=UPI0027DF5644|nr:Gfo/Idh/MocA family oxidoreductase [Paenibacillus sp. LHD-117]MDQ6419714.1 Gfo/Idh/MocA family oxidoreductase [Paenibacillus sp. LHD-117]
MDKVRAAVIGLGSWGESHLEAYRSLPQVELVAICDNRPDRLRAMGEKCGTADRYESYEELLRRDDIDLVSVVTYEKEHLAPTLQALQTGKHVLVEKPISTRLDEARAMLEAAREAGRQVLPGHLLRFDPRYAEIYRSLREGQLGAPVSMYFKRSRQRSLFETYKRTHTVYELSIHDLDLAVWFASSRVISVRAQGRFLTGAAAPEVLWATLQFENGTLAILHSNWMTPDEAGIAIADQVEVIGTGGIAHFETAGSGLQVWSGQGRRTTEFNIHHELNGQTYGALRDQLSFVADCIRGGGQGFDYLSFADAVHGVEIADAIVHACSSGQEIRL